MRRETTEANAKINLFLDVVGRRADGYHLIDGVMQAVTLSDIVSVAFEPGERTEILLTATGNADLPTDMTNLACRAAARYLEAAGTTGRVGIRIEKRIPMAAGLAGGSTDAAAVLRLLDRLAEKPLGVDMLCEIGAKLGADVPFCVRGGAMRTEGIGEILTPCAGLSGCSLVIACAGEGVSTPQAYRRLDERYADFREPRNSGEKVGKLIHALQKADLPAACECMENIFEPTVREVNPYVERIAETMSRSGALRAMMSGSGPSVFGVFANAAAAKAACRALEEIGVCGHRCEPVKPARSE